MTRYCTEVLFKVGEMEVEFTSWTWNNSRATIKYFVTGAAGLVIAPCDWDGHLVPGAS